MHYTALKLVTTVTKPLKVGKIPTIVMRSPSNIFQSLNYSCRKVGILFVKILYYRIMFHLRQVIIVIGKGGKVEEKSTEIRRESKPRPEQIMARVIQSVSDSFDNLMSHNRD